MYVMYVKCASRVGHNEIYFKNTKFFRDPPHMKEETPHNVGRATTYSLIYSSPYQPLYSVGGDDLM